MQRWILYLLLGAAVLVLLGPGLVGLLTERSLERQLERASAGQAPVELSTVRFERGWFTSEGRHRLPVTDPSLAALLLFMTPGAEATDAPPVLILDTTIEHGPVPFGDAGRGAARLVPALASGVSALSLARADGRELPVPGTLESRVALNGAVSLEYRLPAGAAARDGVTARWGDSLVRARGSRDGRELGFGFEMSDGRIEADGRSVQVRAARGDGEMRPTPWGYTVGRVALSAQDGELATADEAATWRDFRLQLCSSVDGDRVGAALALHLDGLDTPAGAWSARIAGSVADFDGAALAPLLRGLRRGPPGGDRRVAYPGIDVDLRRALSAGGRLALSELVVDTPDGRVDANVDIALDGRDGLAEWPGLALAAEARVEVTLPRALAQSGVFRDPLRSLLASGMLVPDGENYYLQAALANGIATINGAPLPLPFNQ